MRFKLGPARPSASSLLDSNRECVIICSPPMPLIWASGQHIASIRICKLERFQVGRERFPDVKRSVRHALQRCSRESGRRVLPPRAVGRATTHHRHPRGAIRATFWSRAQGPQEVRRPLALPLQGVVYPLGLGRQPCSSRFSCMPCTKRAVYEHSFASSFQPTVHPKTCPEMALHIPTLKAD